MKPVWKQSGQIPRVIPAGTRQMGTARACATPPPNTPHDMKYLGCPAGALWVVKEATTKPLVDLTLGQGPSTGPGGTHASGMVVVD
jgi:hypothetical protein